MFIVEHTTQGLPSNGSRSGSRMSYLAFPSLYSATNEEYPDIHNFTTALTTAAGVILHSNAATSTEFLAILNSFLQRTMRCMVDALMWMHSTKVAIAHLDLKLANMLVQNGRLFITDFGLSQKIFIDTAYTQSALGYTVIYAAPELMYDEYNPYKADVYSHGWIFLRLITAMYGTARIEKMVPGSFKPQLRLRGQNTATYTPVYTEPDDPRQPPGLIKLIQKMLKNDDIQRSQMPRVNVGLRRLGGRDSLYNSDCCKHSEAIPSDEYAFSHGKVQGTAELVIPKLPPGSQFRPNLSQPIASGASEFWVRWNSDR